MELPSCQPNAGKAQGGRLFATPSLVRPEPETIESKIAMYLLLAIVVVPRYLTAEDLESMVKAVASQIDSIPVNPSPPATPLFWR